MSASVERSTKKRTMEAADSISLQEDVEAKGKLGREEDEEDVDADNRNNGKEEEEEEDVESKKRNNGREEEQEEEASREEDAKVGKRRNLGKAEENASSLVLLPGAELYFSDPAAFFAAFYKDDDEKSGLVSFPILIINSFDFSLYN
jgi:hypothetical protein